MIVQAPVKTRNVLGISGKDSLAAALLIKAHQPELWGEIELFTTLTGADYPETLQWIDVLPELLGKPIERIEGDLFASIERYTSGDKAFLPSRKQRYCTREAKLEPFEKWLGDSHATLYTGIRADEDRVGYRESKSISSVFPLAQHGFDLGRVWALILALPEQYRPPTFYWPSIHQLAREVWDREMSLMSLDDHITFVQKVRLMAGRSRPNCFFCFNQRRYEVVWLYETHPDLFERMRSYDKPGYSWIKDFALSDLTDEKRHEIKLRRAKKIVNAVMHQTFGAIDEPDGFEGMKSCGLFCGK